MASVSRKGAALVIGMTAMIGSIFMETNSLEQYFCAAVLVVCIYIGGS
jgi:hypothetical protein